MELGQSPFLDSSLVGRLSHHKKQNNSTNFYFHLGGKMAPWQNGNALDRYNEAQRI